MNRENPTRCRNCQAFYATKGKPTPCAPCEYRPPDMHVANVLFDEIYASVCDCRDSYGSLSWELLARRMEWAGLTAEQCDDVLRKAVIVERMIAEDRERKHGASSSQVRRQG